MEVRRPTTTRPASRSGSSLTARPSCRARRSPSGASTRARPEAERVRRLLCHEPRGHADMYGGFLVPPDDDGADLGVLFWHKDGFSTACGHGTIALGAWAVESGRVAAPARRRGRARDRRAVRPRRRARADAGRRGRRASRSATCPPTCSRAASTAARASTVDVAYGGAIYASLPRRRVRAARSSPSDLPRADRARPRDQVGARRHRGRAPPGDERLSGIYGTILYDDLGAAPPAQRRDLRRRRGRPLAVRLGHLGPRGAARRRRAAAGRRRGATTRSSARRSARAWSARRRPRRRRHRGRGHGATGPASTASCSTRATRSARGSCCGERAVPSTPTTSRAARPRRGASTRSRRRCVAGLDPERGPAALAFAARPRRAAADALGAAGAPGVKLVTIGGDPRIQGVYVLFDGETLAPAALLDGIALTDLRTSRGLRARRAPPRRARRAAAARVRPRPAGARARRGAARDPPDRARRHRRPRPTGDVDELVARRRRRLLLHDRARAAVRRRARRRRRHRRRDRLARAGRARDRRRARRPRDGRRRVARLRAARGRRRHRAIAAGALARGRARHARRRSSAATRARPGRPRLFKSTGMAWEDAVVAAAL